MKFGLTQMVYEAGVEPNSPAFIIKARELYKQYQQDVADGKLYVVGLDRNNLPIYSDSPIEADNIGSDSHSAVVTTGSPEPYHVDHIPNMAGGVFEAIPDDFLLWWQETEAELSRNYTVALVP